MMNETTKEWLLKVESHIEEGQLKAPYGMLMALINAASTTMALDMVNWRLTAH